MTGVGAPTTTGWRFFRACVFAVVATAVAAVGHLLGGCDLPDPVMLLTITALLGGSLSCLATRRRTGPQILVALAGSQLLFHGAFHLTAHHDGSVETGRMLVFHVFAALASSWLMAGGESMLFRLFAAFHRILVVPRPGHCRIGLAPTWTAVVTGGAGGVRLRAGELSAVSRRGPPPWSDR